MQFANRRGDMTETHAVLQIPTKMTNSLHNSFTSQIQTPLPRPPYHLTTSAFPSTPPPSSYSPPPPSSYTQTNTPRPSNLHFLTPLRNPIPPKMPPNMLKRQLPTKPHPTMHLNRPISRLRTQPVCIVITHPNLMPQLLFNIHPRRPPLLLRGVSNLIHLRRRAENQQFQHFLLCRQFHQWPLYRLIRRERFAEYSPFLGVLD